MKLNIGAVALFATSVAAQARSNFSSPDFKIHSRPVGECDYTNSLGWVHSDYVYSGLPYVAVLHTAPADAYTGYFTFLPDARSSSLVWVLGGGYWQGWHVDTTIPASRPDLPQTGYGSQGVYADAAHKLQMLSDVPGAWYACPNQALERGPDTSIWWKWTNQTTPSDCIDVDLILEYTDNTYNYPVPCTPSRRRSVVRRSL